MKVHLLQKSSRPNCKIINNSKILTLQKNKKFFNHNDMLNMPRTQVWEEIKYIFEYLITKLAK